LSWPGDVRELKHTIVHACILGSAREMLKPEYLLGEVPAAGALADRTLSEHLESMEWQDSMLVLAADNGRIERAGRQSKFSCFACVLTQYRGGAFSPTGFCG
jgi:transcriptional regulator with PAS, ATPase and Fis domain